LVKKWLEAPAVQNLKPHQVQVDGMRIVGGIDEMLQISVESSTGFSVTGMCQGVLFNSMPIDSPFMLIFSINASGRVLTAADSGIFGTGRRVAGRLNGIRRFSRPHAELHDRERRRSAARSARPHRPLKSTIRSARSPGASSVRSSGTGAGSKPWSVPI
jgi:hypothetical protein